MQVTRYDFKEAVNAFFELPEETAREIIPKHLQPMEHQHGLAILGVTAFDFTDSLVGPYHEIFMSVIVPPMVLPGRPFPVSAFYPLIIGTSTAAARDHAIERWHLPLYPNDIAVEFALGDGKIDVRAREGDTPILDFTVTEHGWENGEQLYQAFMVDAKGRYTVDVRHKGRLSEHEEQAGRLTFHEHPMCGDLVNSDIAPAPFREIWMRDGCQLFDELQKL
jgi:hypothetical protein